MNVNSNRLPILASEIRRAHADVQDAAKTAAERAIVAGHALIEAKSLVPHGGWLPWLREHCALAERTAQLYMKIARSGANSATIADLGLKAAAQAIEMKYADVFPDPFSEGTEEEQRIWWLFCLYLVEHAVIHPHHVTDHVYWIARKDFSTPTEWLTEGPAWVACWGGKIDEHHLPSWAKYQDDYRSMAIDDLQTKLQEISSKTPDLAPLPGKRRRRKAA
jgi:hypothetical protein